MTRHAAHTSRPGTGRPDIAGVLYAEDFDDEAPAAQDGEEQAPEPELIEPVFTAEELEVARAEGRASGRADAERGVAASRVQVLQLIAAGMAEARDDVREIASLAAEATARCMLTALAACLPALCAQHGADEMRALIRTVLPALVDEPRIAIRVHPHLVAVLESELTSLDFEIAEHVTVLPSDGIAPGDVRITWSDGCASRNTAKARMAVEEALAMIGLLERSNLQPEPLDA